MAPAPIALTCGEPAGIGPELAARARARLGDEVPFFWIGDPRHLPLGTSITEIATPGVAGLEKRCVSTGRRSGATALASAGVEISVTEVPSGR